MSSFHIFFINLFLYALPAQTSYVDDLAIGESCEYLEGIVLQQRCIGLYTATMIAKYMDGKMQRLNQFAIYSGENDPSIYLLALRKSVMHFCQRIQWQNGTEFVCMDKGKPEPILLLSAEFHCFEYEVEYCKDLVTLCELENRRKPVFPKISKNAILYAMRSILSEAGAASIRPWTETQLFLILAFVICAYKLLGNI